MNSNPLIDGTTVIDLDQASLVSSFALNFDHIIIFNDFNSKFSLDNDKVAKGMVKKRYVSYEAIRKF
jgi:hypothetical protein